MDQTRNPAVARLWTSHIHDPGSSLAHAKAMLHAEPRLSAIDRAWVELTIAYHHLFCTAQPEEARSWLEPALAAFSTADDLRGEILARTGLARLLIVDQQPLAARDTLLTLYPLALQHLPPGDRFWVINALGAAYFYSERIDEAIRYLYEAFETLRTIDLTPQLPIVMSNLAAALVTVADYAPASELAQDALGLLAHFNNPQLLLFARSNLAEALLGNGDLSGARTLIDAMLPDGEEMPNSLAQNHFCAIAAEVYSLQGDMAAAERCVERAEEIHARHPGGFNEVHLRWARAAVADGQSDDASAIAALEAALQVATRLKHLPTLCKASERAAVRCARLRRFEEAYRYEVVRNEATTERLTSRAGVKYYLLKVQHDLQHARAERDRAERERQESEAINRHLEALNEELKKRMAEIEELQTRLASEAVHDPLTNLFNRRYLDMVIPGLLAAATRRDAPLTIALVDLDHFKRVNDRFGHPAGDQVLAAIGELLGQSLRPSDLSCRYGGEEFCIVLPDTDGPGAKRALDGLASRLSELKVECGDDRVGGFTFSAGIAVFPYNGESFRDLVSAADRALYAAKNSGRNRVLFAAVAQRLAG